ncbi:MAG: NAD(P)-dependent oxidoreductase [Phycisphaera sp.]|nr:NAD(P)-dependent oxidoreductase [Phycisphaera sp.]
MSKFGWIGCGVMGRSMSEKLLEAGHELKVHTRTRVRAEPLLEAGAEWVDSPREAAEGVDAVFSIVGYPEDVESVHLGPEGTLSAAMPPKFLIDLTTSDPDLALGIHERASERSVSAFDAPVSGGDVGARQGTLSIMVGGDEHGFGAIRPWLELMGGTIVLQGGPGAGQRTKIVNQILVAASMVGACEALRFTEAAGLDPARVLESVSSGAAGSWTLSNLVPRILADDHEPGFFVEHFVKDLGIALRSARSMGLELPGLEHAESLYRAVEAAGYGRKGTQVLDRHLRETQKGS